MSPQASDLTPAELIARAKAEMGAGDHAAAQTAALVAIAELLLPPPMPDYPTEVPF